MVVTLARVELATFPLGGGCSIQLSYKVNVAEGVNLNVPAVACHAFSKSSQAVRSHAKCNAEKNAMMQIALTVSEN
jgi:hypothetical protein